MLRLFLSCRIASKAERVGSAACACASKVASRVMGKVMMGSSPLTVCVDGVDEAEAEGAILLLEGVET